MLLGRGGVSGSPRKDTEESQQREEASGAESRGGQTPASESLPGRAVSCDNRGEVLAAREAHYRLCARGFIGGWSRGHPLPGTEQDSRLPGESRCLP